MYPALDSRTNRQDIAGPANKNACPAAARHARSPQQPWDVLLVNKKVYIAMAGHHQIWVLDPAKERVDPYAGTATSSSPTARFQVLFRPTQRLDDRRQEPLRGRRRDQRHSLRPLGGKGFVSTIVGKGFSSWRQDGKAKRPLAARPGRSLFGGQALRCPTPTTARSS